MPATERKFVCTAAPVFVTDEKLRLSVLLFGFVPAAASDESCVPQVGQDVLKEVERDPLRLRDDITFGGRALVGTGQLDHGPYRVVGFR